MVGLNFTPDQLAQMAQASFRPPLGVYMPGLNLNQPAPGLIQNPGFSLGQGMGIAGNALNAMSRMPGSGYQLPTPISPDYTSGPLTPGSVTPGAAPVQPGQMLSTSAIDQAQAGVPQMGPQLPAWAAGFPPDLWADIFGGGTNA